MPDWEYEPEPQEDDILDLSAQEDDIEDSGDCEEPTSHSKGNQVFKKGPGSTRDSVCSECLADAGDCDCPLLDDIELRSRRDSIPSEAEDDARPRQKRVREELEAEYALWYYDTRFSYRPKWANDYLRLPPYQFYRASPAVQEAEEAPRRSRRTCQCDECYRGIQEESPRPGYAPLSHVRSSGGTKDQVQSRFKGERIREAKARSRNRSNSARSRTVLNLFRQVFQSGTD